MEIDWALKKGRSLRSQSILAGMISFDLLWNLGWWTLRPADMSVSDFVKIVS